jgi:hypothetical protein
MNRLSGIALLVALVSLGIAIVPRPNGNHDRDDLSKLSAQVTALESQLALRAEENKALKQALTALETKPEPAVVAQPASGLNEVQVRELVQNEIRQQMGRNGGQQQRMAGMPSPEEMRTVLKDQIGVEGEKADQALKIMDDFRTTTREIWTKGGSREANIAAMREAEKKTETELAAVLDEQQIAKLKEWRDSQFRRGRRGPGTTGATTAVPDAPKQPADF